MKQVAINAQVQFTTTYKNMAVFFIASRVTAMESRDDQVIGEKSCFTQNPSEQQEQQDRQGGYPLTPHLTPRYITASLQLGRTPRHRQAFE
jgi:hypothetical protein